MKTQASALNLHGVGRRKKAVARVWVKPGTGNVVVNGEKYAEYFDTDFNRHKVVLPLKVLGLEKNFDITVNVNGGGLAGQADAVKLGISRALLLGNETVRPTLRQNGLLTVDDRIKERKKYGQKGARRKFQFVKR